MGPKPDQLASGSAALGKVASAAEPSTGRVAPPSVPPPVQPPESESLEKSESSATDNDSYDEGPFIPKSHLRNDLKKLGTALTEGIPTQELDESDSFSRFATNKIPGMIGLRGLKANGAAKEKMRIAQALLLGEVFRGQKDEPTEGLTRSNRRKPAVQRALSIVESTFVQLEVLHEGVGIFAARMNPASLQNLAQTLHDFMSKYERIILARGDPIPTMPKWGESNDIHSFWSLNDFEILVTCYRKDCEDFIYEIAPYCPGNNVLSSKSKLKVNFESDSTNSTPTPFPAYRSAQLGEYGDSASSALTYSRTPSVGIANRFSAVAGSSSAVIGDLMADRQSSEARRGTRQTPPHLPEDPNDPFRDNGRPQRTPSQQASGAPDDGPSGSDSDPDGEAPDRRGRRNPRTPVPRSRKIGTQVIPTAQNKPREYHIELKLKPETIPTWGGNEDELARWIDEVNTLGDYSEDVYKELGRVTPRRFTGSAKTWYYTIPSQHRKKMEESWGTLKAAIGNYWMNHQWVERQKIRANLARFRDSGNSREAPSEYVLRKLDLLRIVYQFTDTEFIQMIMKEAPSSWHSIIQPHNCRDLVEFQNTVRYHDITLIDISTAFGADRDRDRSTYPSTARSPFRPNRPPFQPSTRARTNLVGWSKDMPAPQFPKDDKNVSKSRTPESIGARPCRHCGSGMHWDKECYHAKQGEKRVRSNFASTYDDDMVAQEEYDELYYASDAEDF